MYIKSVSLQSFRNYESEEVSLSQGLNVFRGNNAQGKTNFLESIYLSSIGKSPKTSKDRDLINWKENKAKIKVVVQKKYYEQTIEIFLNAKDKKTVKINSIPIKKIGDLIGEMPVVYFAPDEIGLIKDGPFERRRFMDIDISQMNKNYFYALLKFEKLLNERNNLLKKTKSFDALLDTIDLWDTQMADTASKIIFYRLDFLNKLKEPARRAHLNITSQMEELEINYQGIRSNVLSDIKDKIYKQYKQTIKKDYELGYTTIGPHRDDIEIKINGVDIRNFGSQGQQRLATLSMKVAELKIFTDLVGEKPILLLDDVLSELDASRSKNFLNEIKDYQTILTTTKYSRKLGENDAVFSVKSAVIERVK